MVPGVFGGISGGSNMATSRTVNGHIKTAERRAPPSAPHAYASEGRKVPVHAERHELGQQ